MKNKLITLFYTLVGVFFIYFTSKLFGIDLGSNSKELINILFLVIFGFLIPGSFKGVTWMNVSLSILTLVYVVVLWTYYYEAYAYLFSTEALLIYIVSSFLFGISVYYFYKYINFKISEND